LIEGRNPTRSSKFATALEAAAKSRIAFTNFVSDQVVGKIEGAKPGLIDVVKVVPDLVKAITDAGLAIWEAFAKADKERRDAVLSEVDHLRWRAFADLAPKPDNLSFDQAAAVPVGALTAWGVVIDAAAVQLGQTVLVQGAAGGVGLFAVQLARWKGAHVIGTTSAKNVDFVRSLGAEEVIDYQADPFEMSVHDVDAVIDTVGGDVTERSLHVLRPGGIFVTVANMTPEEQAKALGVRVARGSRPGADVLCQITELIESSKIHPVVGPVFSLAEAGKAQVQGETGHGRGRIILHITDA